MEDELEAVFASETDKKKRYNYLASILQDGGEYSGFYGNYRQVYKLYIDWRESNRVVWPYAGGRLAQPVRVQHDMDAIGYREEFYRLRNDPDVIRKSTAPLFKVSDIL